MVLGTQAMPIVPCGLTQRAHHHTGIQLLFPAQDFCLGPTLVSGQIGANLSSSSRVRSFQLSSIHCRVTIRGSRDLVAKVSLTCFSLLFSCTTTCVTRLSFSSSDNRPPPKRRVRNATSWRRCMSCPTSSGPTFWSSSFSRNSLTGSTYTVRPLNIHPRILSDLDNFDAMSPTVIFFITPIV